MKDLLILKLTGQKPDNKEEMLERIKGGWKVSPKRLDDVKYVVVLFEQRILGTFSLGDVITYNKKIGKVTHLDLIETDDLDIIGQRVSYRTSNPATLSSFENLFENK